MTIKEIARLAGVSISTVSKVMNHKDASISPETRDKVLRIVKEFNYTPYSNTNLPNAASKTFTLGLLIRSAETSLSLNSIIKAARSLGYTVLVSDSANQPEQEFLGVTALCRHGVDGVLWEPLNEDSLNFAESFRTSKIPFLLFNYSHAEGALNIDFEQMGYDATMALVQAHHTDIACLLSPGTRTERFLNGYKKCLFDNGIPFLDSMVYQEPCESLIHKITSHAITGIVSSHSSAANHLHGELSSLHYQIPYEVSLVSLKNDSRAHTVYPEISKFTTPHFAFGRHLCEQLVAMMENPDHVPLAFETHPTLDNRTTIAIPYSHRNQPLLVVGSINLDTYLKMEQLPYTGKSMMTSSSSVYPGGKGVNQAIGAAKLGAHVSLIGAVGSDVESDLIYEALKAHSIDASEVRRCTDAATGKAFIFVQRDGDSLISILSGANSYLSPDDIKKNSRYFENCRYCLVQTEIPQDTVMTTCHMARAHGVSIILKPSTCSYLDPELLPYINILVPNLNEINLLCPDGTLSEKADYFLDRGVETVIISLGADGCYYKTKTMEESIPAIPFQAIDNTGACDAFISALAVYLQEGYPMEKAVRIANYAGGFSITREGVPDSLVDRSSLERYIFRHEPELLNIQQK